MAYYNDGKVFRNLPEQVEKNKSDIESIQDAQKADESNINTNLNNINAHETRINALESLKMTQDGQNIKLTKSTGEIGNIAVGTVGGTNLLGGNDVTFKTINGEAITGEGNLTVDTNLSALLWANLGIGRWRNTYLFGSTMYDDLASNYTDYSYYMAFSTFVDAQTGKYISDDVHFNNPTSFFNPDSNGSYVFTRMKNNTGTLYVPSITARGSHLFFGSDWSKILVEPGCTAYITLDAQGCWEECPNLTEIGEFDMSKMTVMWGNCISQNVELMHCKHWKKSFSIKPSTKFTQEALVEIISNLDTVSNSPVLTMGTVNLSKLTADQIAIATGKGWTLA